MTSVPDKNEHWLTTIKRGMANLQQFSRAMQAPVGLSECVYGYGKIILNIQSGLLVFGKTKTQLRTSKPPFKILRLLVLANGKEVAYREIIKSLDLPEKTKRQKRESKKIIGNAIRDLRRRLKVKENKQKNRDSFMNPFIPTGQGLKLAYLSD